MKVLVIGSGARDHALFWKLSRDGHDVFFAPGNPNVCEARVPMDPASLAKYASSQGVDLTIVGPEAPLAAGIANYFHSCGLALFGPTQAAARLESSKAFSKGFMQRYGVPTARFTLCDSPEKALQACGTYGYRVAIKPSGLTAGKGVSVCQREEDCARVIGEISRYGRASDTLIVEECLVGEECSIHLFCDGRDYALFPPSRDHKRLLDGDQGPNTGGMGAVTVSLSASLFSEIEESIIQRSIEGLKKDGIDYCGILYIGLMLTAEGPKVLEYNCRLGDPECQTLLPLLKSDLASTCLACIHGQLKGAPPHFSSEESFTVVMTSSGYPDTPSVPSPIQGLEMLQDVQVFHAATSLADGQALAMSGRILSVNATAATLYDAQDKVYSQLKNIHFEGAHYRQDIGAQCVGLAI